MIDFLAWIGILPRMDDHAAQILIEPVEPPCVDAPRLYAEPPPPLTNGQDVLAQVLRREAMGDPDFQLTPTARMDVATMVQALPVKRR